MIVAGSSPLTRGKQLKRPGGRVRPRLIPAHAGKTWRRPRRAPGKTAHPRSRGENRERRRGGSAPAGSSPLTRGKREGVQLVGVVGRLIPAHAGKTDCAASLASSAAAHPRSRGENLGRHRDGLQDRGSSPLTRGKHSYALNRVYRNRLIPAHAGKTFPGGRRRGHGPAHPRSRGENVTQRRNAAASGGSSPLTRGKPLRTARRADSRRLIPAHAGKTSCGRPGSGLSPAHPRSRGENFGVDCDVDVRAGSSPLTRGKHFLTCAFIAQIDQILESLELCASSGSYSLMDAYATDAPQDRVRSIGLAPLSSRGAS